MKSIDNFLSLLLAVLLLCPIKGIAQQSQNIPIGFNIVHKQTGPLSIIQSTQVPIRDPGSVISFYLVMEGTGLNYLRSQIDQHQGLIAPLQFRTKRIGNNWSQWQELGVDEHAEVNPLRMVTELVFLSREATVVEFRMEVSNQNGFISVDKLEFNFYSPEYQKVDFSDPAQFSDNNNRGVVNCSLPPYVTRTGWGCPDGQNPSCNPPVYTTVSHLIVHHSAGNNSSSNWGGIVLSYWNYHTNGNGWCDIGYNWLVDANGLLYEGRGGGDNVRGGHMCGHNTYTMGVCVMGTYMTVLPTTATLDMLVQLLSWKATIENINPTASSWHSPSGITLPHIAGHRDGCSPGYTSCPGNMLHAYLPTVRTDVESFINSGCTSCEANTMVSNNFSSGVHIYKASGILNADNDISGSADVTYQGGSLVKMNLGFKVLPGATFKANLSGCN